MTSADRLKTSGAFDLGEAVLAGRERDVVVSQYIKAVIKEG